MRRNRQFAPVIMLEQLEDRRLRAGNVTAVVDPATHTLKVTGDNKANAIFFGPDTTGLVVAGLPGTTVNGAASFAVTADISGGVTIDMGNGNDTVNLGPLSVTAITVSVDTGNGDDSVSVNGWNLENASLTVNTGSGDDHVSIDSIELLIASSVKIDTGNGDDKLDFNGGFVKTGCTLDIEGGHGNDTRLAFADVFGPGTIIDNF